MRTPAGALAAYGEWIPTLAPWTHFVTLTHRLPDSSDAARARGYTQVGLQKHRREVRKWFYDDVRRYDPGARWWSEMELHQTGIPHEHGLLAIDRDTAPVYSMGDAWWNRTGGGMYRVVRIGDQAAVAQYVAKYASKSAAWEPCVWGFALNARASFAQVLR